VPRSLLRLLECLRVVVILRSRKLVPVLIGAQLHGKGIQARRRARNMASATGADFLLMNEGTRRRLADAISLENHVKLTARLKLACSNTTLHNPFM
jgi:hypothetical protein